MSRRIAPDTRPEISKKHMLIFLTAIAKIIVREYSLNRPDQVTGEHVDSVYHYLWGTDELKFAAEIHLDGGVVEKYLWEAVDKRINML